MLRVTTFGLAAIFLVGCGQKPSQPVVHAQTGSTPSAGANFAVDPLPPVTGEAVPSSARNGVTLPAGTHLRVRLSQTLDTKYCAPGQKFSAVLDEPLVIGRRVVVPKGATVRGHITASRQSGRLKGRAVLGLSLDSVQVDGSSYDIATNFAARVSSSHKKRNLAIIGGSSGGGAAIGAVAGGGVGAAIGAAAGAGAGTVGALFTGRKQVILPVETELTFQLRAPLTVKG